MILGLSILNFHWWALIEFTDSQQCWSSHNEFDLFFMLTSEAFLCSSSLSGGLSPILWVIELPSRRGFWELDSFQLACGKLCYERVFYHSTIFSLVPMIRVVGTVSVLIPCPGVRSLEKTTIPFPFSCNVKSETSLIPLSMKGWCCSCPTGLFVVGLWLICSSSFGWLIAPLLEPNFLASVARSSSEMVYW